MSVRIIRASPGRAVPDLAELWQAGSFHVLGRASTGSLPRAGSSFINGMRTAVARGSTIRPNAPTP